MKHKTYVLSIILLSFVVQACVSVSGSTCLIAAAGASSVCGK